MRIADIEKKLFEAGQTSRILSMARKQVFIEASKGLIAPEELEGFDQRIQHNEGMKTKYMLRYMRDGLLAIQGTIHAIEEAGSRASKREISMMFSDIKLLLPDLIAYLTRVSTDSDWMPVTDELPHETRSVYVTVEEKERGHKVLEGFFEDGKWFDADGHSLKRAGLDVVAWMLKDLPEPYIPLGNSKQDFKSK